jgi:hypothetical protein
MIDLGRRTAGNESGEGQPALFTGPFEAGLAVEMERG